VHNEELELFHVGRTVGPGVRRFVENGDTELIEQEKDRQIDKIDAVFTECC
jgi:hypothetical protein